LKESTDVEKSSGNKDGWAKLGGYLLVLH
jgi:hypothetical protein